MKNHDIAAEAVKTLPPVSVVGLTLAGLELSDWVLVFTLLYTIFMIIDKLPVVYARVCQFIAFLRRFRK